MKHSLTIIGIILIISCAMLGACSGTPQEDVALPTLAQLPTLADTDVPATVAVSAPIPTADNSVVPSPPAAPTENNGTTAQPTPSVIVVTAASDDLGTGAFPDTFAVGTQITLKGTFTTVDTKSGTGYLTNDQGRAVLLLVDPASAELANNQLILINGEVVKPVDPTAGNTIHVTTITLPKGALATSS